MTKEANQKFKNSTKYWIYGNEYIGNNVKVSSSWDNLVKKSSKDDFKCLS